MDIEELIDILKKGEGQTTEFKKSFTKAISKDICAFSNTDGGTVLIGVNDQGKIKGVKKDIKQDISNSIQSICPFPKINIKKMDIQDKTVFIVQVEKSKPIHAVRNIVYMRLGSNNRPLSMSEIVELEAENLKVYFDSLPSPAKKSDISKTIARKYFTRREKNRGVKYKGSLHENLKKIKVFIKDNKISNGGLLFFCKNPQEYIMSAKVRLIWFISEEMKKYKDRKDFTGPIWKIVDDVEEYLSKNLRVTGGSMAGFKRLETFEYPLDALREALINALIHRNYFDPGEVMIFIFPHKLVIKNPGGFPPDVTVDDPEHKPRNPLLAQYMYDWGYIEKYGHGIKMMQEECETHPLVDLTFKLKPHRVSVIFEKVKESILDEYEEHIITLLKGTEHTSSELSKRMDLSKNSVLKRLKRLMKLGLVKKIGKGPRTRYTTAKS